MIFFDNFLVVVQTIAAIYILVYTIVIVIVIVIVKLVTSNCHI
jgi:hypothetical protein